MTTLSDLSEFDRECYEVAAKMALKALSEAEVPVGCVFVYEGDMIGTGHNLVNRRMNPTMHAEMVAVENVTEWCKTNNKDPKEVFPKCTLYVNLEPCCMCASAIHQLGVKRVIYGAPNDRFGGMGSVMSNEDFKHQSTVEVVPNVDLERSVQMLRDFYKRENPFAPPEKRKTRGKIPGAAVDPETQE